MKKLTGYMMIASVFGLIFAGIAFKSGILFALVTFGISCGLTALIVGGVHLIVD